MKNMIKIFVITLVVLNLSGKGWAIPLPEHPRPDFERAQWMNLNGEWDFEFDSLDTGLKNDWSLGKTDFKNVILVPFSWGSKLSKVQDLADIAWYKRNIKVPKAWNGKRIFVTIGASDWHTTAWLDGHLLGAHQGGYTPFSFELTDYVTPGRSHTLVIRADDARREFTLYGKQGYGNARGIWQTVYLEARGKVYLDALRIVPNIDQNQVSVTACLQDRAPQDTKVSIAIETENGPVNASTTIPAGEFEQEIVATIPDARLWTLDDPFLYDITIKVGDDVVKSYFGMRKISVVNLPGTEYPYVALNDKPVYLQLALDQSYHPDGFYTFPTDEFMKNEIERSKSIGLNGIRPHIKVEIPRKLYWADKLGLLVMQDLPNSWGTPDKYMQAEAEYTLRQMIKRDFNHPAIFSWIVFNETWGLWTHIVKDGEESDQYLPKTQYWVSSMYYLAKSLDPTRLVEDNSICCGVGHTETDINSFHSYLPGWGWEGLLSEISENAFPGSSYQFEPGFKQGGQPTINSECGNVWGYDGSTGDVDWSWDYHRMMNTFRQFPEIAGWLYTEHHDVINEWNGYWRFDRSMKFTGLGSFVDGMDLNDLHAPIYLSTGKDICLTVKGGEQVKVPLFLSSMTDQDYGDELTVEYEMDLLNTLGESNNISAGKMQVEYSPFVQTALAPLKLEMPMQAGVATLKLVVKDEQNTVLHRNFMLLKVQGEQTTDKYRVISVPASDFSDQQWSKKQWNVLGGLKVNGAGSGYFEYEFPGMNVSDLEHAKDIYMLFELGAKQLFVKDMDQTDIADLDYMRGAKAEPSQNPNAYPMTDETLFPSDIRISVNGKQVYQTTLQDDPADHRGVLSWHHQLQDHKLREAGSYGYLVKVPVNAGLIQSGQSVKVRIESVNGGGLAVYGKSFGRYPVGPSLVIGY